MSKKELRELDAWIAEHLFGYVWVRFVKGDPWCGKRSLEDPLLLKRSNLAMHSDRTEQLAPDWYGGKAYSTDPAAAMTVLEKCFEKVGTTVIECGRIDSFYMIWLSGDDGLNRISAETLPLAISKFAKQIFSE